jgi:hypothetical protein
MKRVLLFYYSAVMVTPDGQPVCPTYLLVALLDVHTLILVAR